MPHNSTPKGLGKGVGRVSKDKTAAGEIRHQHQILDEKIGENGQATSSLLQRTTEAEPYRAQTKINAFNFPFTGNSGGGCFLRQPLFQMHRTLPRGRELDVSLNFGSATEVFLRKNAHLPQYMKRVQWGIATEMWYPGPGDVAKPAEGLRAFQKFGQSWMLHIITKSPKILEDADLLAEMKHQVQVEVGFVTLNEEASQIFETGTQSVRQRLNIVEELSRRGVFVRVMMMPCMREYVMQTIDEVRHIVFEHRDTGKRAAGYKRVSERDGNAEGEKVGMELHIGKRWKKVPPGESRLWKPVILKDWSDLTQMQASWRNWGAKAYKQKDLNYYYVDELIKAHQEVRAPKPERGRMEDPTAECLIQSGESVVDEDGNVRTVEVRGHHKPRKHWSGANTPPLVRRNVMDFGYRLHSSIDWVDCI
ncbi:MAG: DNA repair photolyase [Verrucomicrobia bacterium]|nr:MAG: DNA repair photolyase [Verrucomicrobiota bacterium]